MRASALNPAGAASPFPANTGATPSSCVHTSSPACAYVTESWSPFAEGSQIRRRGHARATSPPRQRACISAPASARRRPPGTRRRPRGAARTSRTTPRGRCHVSSRSSRSIPGDPRMSSSCARRAAHSAASARPPASARQPPRGAAVSRAFFFASSACASAQSAAAPSTSARSDRGRRGVPPVHARVAHHLGRLRPPLLARHAVHLALAEQTAHRRRRGAAETHHDPVRGAQPEHRRAADAAEREGVLSGSLSVRSSLVDARRPPPRTPRGLKTRGSERRARGRGPATARARRASAAAALRAVTPPGRRR